MIGFFDGGVMWYNEDAHDDGQVSGQNDATLSLPVPSALCFRGNTLSPLMMGISGGFFVYILYICQNG